MLLIGLWAVNLVLQDTGSALLPLLGRGRCQLVQAAEAVLEELLHDIWRGHLQFDRFEAFDVLSDGGGHRCVDLVFLRRLAGQLQAANKVRIQQDELFFVVIWHDVELCPLLEDRSWSSRALIGLILLNRL